MHPKVAISSEFFSSVLKLPKTQQEKAVKFMELFRQDPTSAGINYETIQAARDKNLRSVRIDQAYRAIVLAPDEGMFTFCCGRISTMKPMNGPVIKF
jgi:hypothetical protein